MRVRPDIALYLPNLDGGGAERMMVNLAAGFSRRGLETHLVLAKARGPYLGEVAPAVRVVDLASAGVTASLPGLVRYLRRERPRALLATLNHASVVALLARALAGGRRGMRVRVVVRESNMLFPNPSANLRGRLLRVAVRRVYPAADAFVAVSEGVAADLARYTGVDPAKIRTVYNPVVSAELLGRAHESPPHPFFAPGEPPVVLGVGRLGVQKDFFTLIRAFARVAPETSARLVILGEGDKRGELEALVRDLGLADRVSLPGFADNPFAYMARADTFVLSSRFEGLPGALIQAMACGCKVVSTDCRSGPAEILRGGLAPLVPVGDVPALAAAIRESLELPAAPPALAARARDFSEERAVPGYLGVLLPGRAEGAPARTP